MKLNQEMLLASGVPPLAKKATDEVLRDLYDTLELQVGRHLAEQLEQSELDDFDAVFQSSDEEAAVRWLEKTLPDYSDVVRTTLGSILAAVKVALLTAEKSGVLDDEGK